MGNDAGAELIRLHRPWIESDFLSSGSPFSLPISGMGIELTLTGLQYSIYDEEIDAFVLRSKFHDLIVANNTYLPSFAYNLAIVWSRYGYQNAWLLYKPDCELARLLRYNLKKFFAEQLLHRANTAFARAVFLETLLFDERAMRPLFAQANVDAAFASRLKFFGKLFSNLLIYHEIGHIVADKIPDFSGRLSEELKGFSFDINHLASKFPLDRREFECDAFAIIMAWYQRDESIDAGFYLRVIAFAFAVLACMSGLGKSAVATTQAYPPASDPDLLDEPYAKLPGASFKMGRDELAIERARAAAALCARLSPDENILYTNTADFPFHPSLIDVLANFSLDVLANDDEAERGLCELVARSLQGHPRGIRYLRLRSKSFLRGDEPAK